MSWIDDLQTRFDNGDDPQQVFEDFKAHRVAEEQQHRHTPLTRDQVVLMVAFESNDWDTLEPWLNDDGAALTSEATRLLLDAWDIKDAQSQ